MTGVGLVLHSILHCGQWRYTAIGATEAYDTTSRMLYYLALHVLFEDSGLLCWCTLTCTWFLLIYRTVLEIDNHAKFSCLIITEQLDFPVIKFTKHSLHELCSYNPCV